MQLTLRTLTNETFTIEVKLSETVEIVKQKIEAERGQQYPAANQRLICAGVIWQNNVTLGEYNVTEASIVITMITKPLQPANPPSNNEAQPAHGPHATQHTGNVFQCAMRDRLRQIGFSEEQIEQALMICSYNYDLASDCLMNGMFGEHDGSEFTLDYDDEEEELEEPENPLEFLRSEPLFIELRETVQEHPNQLKSIMEEVRNTNPDMYNLISQHQAVFIEMLGETPSSQPLEQLEEQETESMESELGYITVNAQEKEAIDRLVELGFPEVLVIQAYFICQKDEGLAAHYLFAHTENEENLL